MTKRKIYLLIQSALCVLIALLLAVSAVRIFVEGSAYQAAGHPSEWIYTREKVAAALALILPLFLISLAMTVFALIKDIRDEDADQPVQDAELGRGLTCSRATEPAEAVKADAALYKTSPETARRRVLVRRVLLVAAVCFVIMGIMNGSMKDVLVKAIRICTECVGLG